jgi:hypothetical protein
MDTKRVMEAKIDPVLLRLGGGSQNPNEQILSLVKVREYIK